MPDAAWFGDRVALVALVVSFVAAIFSGLQMKASRKQASEAQRSRELAQDALDLQARAIVEQSGHTTKALEIAERNAMAVERNLETTKLIAETGQRAWIVFCDVQIVFRSTSELPTLVVLTVKNDGATPAYSELYCEWSLGSYMATEMTFSNPPAHSTIGPRSSNELKVYPKLNDSEDAAIRKGNDNLLICARANYSDVFGKSHHADYCVQYHPPSKTFIPWQRFNFRD